jgi:hypothetical protein
MEPSFQEAHLGERPIRDLGLTIAGTLLEPVIAGFERELEAAGIRRVRPRFYLSTEWGVPFGTVAIAIPFYLARPDLTAIHAERTGHVEGLGRWELLRYLRHEMGHVVNYAYKLYEREGWVRQFGPITRPYREEYRPEPFSRRYVRHLPGWYAQKHPDEDFAETFAVWLTPDVNWERDYDGWGALKKLRYVERVMKEVAHQIPTVPEPSEDDLPVAAMQYTVAEHYQDNEENIPIRDDRIFDGDLKTIFADAEHAPGAASAADFIATHKREIVTRISYWTGENASIVRHFIDFLRDRSDRLNLKLSGLEAATLIELTAFGTAVMMNYRYTNAIDGGSGSGDR